MAPLPITPSRRHWLRTPGACRYGHDHTSLPGRTSGVIHTSGCHHASAVS
jgi:hypothetical protein